MPKIIGLFLQKNSVYLRPLTKMPLRIALSVLKWRLIDHTTGVKTCEGLCAQV